MNIFNIFYIKNILVLRLKLEAFYDYLLFLFLIFVLKILFTYFILTTIILIIIARQTFLISSIVMIVIAFWRELFFSITILSSILLVIYNHTIDKTATSKPVSTVFLI